ncbi:hypothetical protein CSKR_106494 [Clonorchis sinensis]|uniref:Uncharacterized protein n=1 Tax=Clonorchis sinensis TaxID=79923 RepID=A0A419PJ77_CLOSI|nr:hypothetical protein CSKR_106494 [Clonorchis sinensis]
MQFAFKWNRRLTETRRVRPLDDLQEGRNRSWAVEEFSATLFQTMEVLSVLHSVSSPDNTPPPHAPVATIFEISRYMYIRNGLLIRLLKTLRQPTTGFALLGAHQVGAVPEFPSTLCST